MIPIVSHEYIAPLPPFAFINSFKQSSIVRSFNMTGRLKAVSTNNRANYKGIPIYSYDEISPYTEKAIHPCSTFRHHFYLSRIPAEFDPNVPAATYILKTRATINEINMTLAAAECAVRILVLVTDTNHIIPSPQNTPDGFLMDYRISLADLLVGGLEMTQRKVLASQAINLLSTLHAEPRAIIHGDFKPDNLIYDGKRLLLIDFEMAQHMSSVTFDRSQQSTPRYRSPQRIKVGFTSEYPVRKEDDYYALAWTLYEIITGDHPFPNTTDLEAMSAIRKGQGPDLTKVTDLRLLKFLEDYLKMGNSWT